ncbi:MAG: glycosyltransferase family 1 protein [Pseudomonadales bacterium]
MKIIVGGQAILGETGGVGVYTQSLIQELAKDANISELRILANNRLWHLSEIDPHGKPDSDPSQTPMDLLKKIMPSGVKQFVGRRLREHRLSQSDGFLLHETNHLLLQRFQPAIVTIHDLSCLLYPEFHPPARAKIFTQHLRTTAQRAAHIITVSNTVRTEVINHFGLSEQDVTAIPLATSHLAARSNVTPPKPETPYFLVVGALEPRKNIGLILDAILSLSRRNIEVKVVHVGPPGWANQNIMARLKWAQERGLWDELGVVTPAHLSALYSSATALLYPSVYEGFGLPPFEAKAYGCPVVLSDIPVFRELHKEGVVWVSGRDFEELAEAMAQLLSDHDEASRLGLAAQNGSNRVSWRETAKATVAVYKQFYPQ